MTIDIHQRSTSLPTSKFSTGKVIAKQSTHKLIRSCPTTKPQKFLFPGRHFWVSKYLTQNIDWFLIPQYFNKYTKFACLRAVFIRDCQLIDIRSWVASSGYFNNCVILDPVRWFSAGEPIEIRNPPPVWRMEVPWLFNFTTNSLIANSGFSTPWIRA